MVNEDELRQLVAGPETDGFERKSAWDRARIGEAICAFANDLPRRERAGILVLGVRDNGSCAGLEIDDRLLQSLAGFRTDGNIVPQPEMDVSRRTIDGCTMAVVEVQPSRNPPVRFDGRTCIRIGARRGHANPDEERRLTEKRQWQHLPFDQQPVRGSSCCDLDLLRFRQEYRPSTIFPEKLSENAGDTMDQLRALRFLDSAFVPTVAGQLVFGKDPRFWLPGAYVQFVRYPGSGIGETVLDHKTLGGTLAEVMRRLDEVLNANIRCRAELSPRQVDRPDYPTLALQELLRNAVIHRNYEATAAPVGVAWFDDRVEISSPGGPFGAVTIENFGQLGVADRRNPTLAEAAKALGYVQSFGSGIARARAALERNGNPPPEFRVEASWVHVEVRASP